MIISELLGYISLGITGFAFMFALYYFLQRGKAESSLTRKEIEYIKAELREARNYANDGPSEIYSAVKTLKKEIEEVKSNLSHVSEEERFKIVDNLKIGLKETASEEILEEIQRQIEERYKSKAKLSLIEEHFDNAMGRLKEELFSLSKRSNLNLSLGVTTTLVGLGLLGAFVLNAPNSFENTTKFVENFVPRMSLVVFIEIFAYFFLRLYKDTLSEIKYFQNEITNIESKYLAVRMALSSGSEEGVIHSVDNLLATERNHILSKGQTTVEIEKARTEQQLTESVLEKVAGVFSKSPNE